MSGYAAIGLSHPKIEWNVGGVMRAVHCFGGSMIAISGHRYKKQHTDTTKAWRSIPLLHTEANIMDLCPYDCIPVAVEFLDKSVCLTRFAHPKRAFYIFGAEDQTLGKDVIDRCKYVIKVPTAFCLNLAATVNVVLYDRNAKAISIKRGWGK